MFGEIPEGEDAGVEAEDGVDGDLGGRGWGGDEEAGGVGEGVVEDAVGYGVSFGVVVVEDHSRPVAVSHLGGMVGCDSSERRIAEARRVCGPSVCLRRRCWQERAQ